MGLNLKVIKIFTEREDRTSILSSPDVCKEISNQTEAKKKSTVTVHSSANQSFSESPES